jgi:hypothetical protein
MRAGGFFLGFLVAIVLVIVVALSAVHRAACGPRDTARPQWFVVVPTQPVPEDCRQAKSGYEVLTEYLGVGSGS